MQHMIFSEVKRAHGLLRFLWPVQSWGQVKTMALIYAIGLPLMAIVVCLNDADALWGTLVCGVLGSTWALYIHLPATLEVRTRSDARHCVGEVSDILRCLNYAEGERCGQNLHFTPHKRRWMHKFPSYLSWKETELDLSAHGRTITLRGPKFVLNIVKRRGERGTVQSAFRF